MANLATDVVWGSSPTLKFNFTYSKQRNGTTQQYKIGVECEPTTSGQYFGYPIYLEITVNGSVAATKTLKSADPWTWSSAISYTTGWINVANKTTGSTPLKIRIYSGSGSTRNTTYSYTLPIDPAPSKVSATDANIGSKSTVSFTRYNSSFTHSLAYKATGQSSYTAIISKQNITSYSWTLPTSLNESITSGKTVDVSLRCQTYNGSTLVGTSYCTITATATPSKISATSVNIGSASTITFTRYASGFTHTLSYKATGQSSYTTIFSMQDVTSYKWTIPTALCGLITTGNTINITLRCETYNGKTSVGATTCTITATAEPSKVAATDANIGSTSIVTFTRDNSSFTHTLAYKAAGQTSYKTIFSKQDVTSYSWTVPTSLYALIPKAKTIDITLRCETYNDSTLIGTTTCEMTATAAESKCSPTISVTAVDSNENTIALTGSDKKIIRYHSDIKVTATVKANNEADISKTTLKCGSKSASAASYTFTDAESIDVIATTTDTRGYSASAEATGLEIVNYIKLTNNATVKRESPTSDKVIVETKGNYFNGSFGAVNNTLRLQVRYKPKSKAEFDETDTWTEMTVKIDGNSYTAEATLTGLDYRIAYDIRVRATDQIYKHSGPLANAVYHNLPLGKGIPVYDWGESDFNFNVPVILPGGQYRRLNSFGIDAKNSDIINLNGLFFRDDASADDEGLLFYRNGENWDRVWASGGNLYFGPNSPSETKSYKLFYAPGDTETQTENTMYSGMVTGSTQNLFFFIPLAKPVIATSVTLSGKVIARGANGHLNGSTASEAGITLSGGDGYSVTATLQNNGVWVRVSFESKITNATNNSSASVGPYGTITITFA